MVSNDGRQYRWRAVMGAALLAAFAGGLATATPARADGWDRGGDRHWEGGRGWDRGYHDRGRWEDWRRHEYWEHRRPVYGYGYYPAPRIYYPPPPPVYYAPGPYYPGSFNVTIPIR